MFTKVNRGGFREIRTGVGRTVKTRTNARDVWSSFAKQRTKLSGTDIVRKTKNGVEHGEISPLIMHVRINDA